MMNTSSTCGENTDRSARPQRLGKVPIEVLRDVEYITSFSNVHVGIAALAVGVTDEAHARKLGLV